MGSSGFKVWNLFTITILSLALLTVFPGTGKAVKRLKPPLDVPQAFRQLGASVPSVRFYATPTPEGVPMQARVYTTSFFNAETRYIWWEIGMKTEAKRDRPVRLITWVTWQRADGSEFNQSIVATVPPDLKQVYLAAGWQDNRPGGWLPGTYRVTIQIDDIQVAMGRFQILDKLFKDK
jgi:hypothetical protein